MKEWIKALEKTRILAPADIRYLFFVWKLWPFKVEIPVLAIFTIIIIASVQLIEQRPDIHGAYNSSASSFL